jgi:plastocyanin
MNKLISTLVLAAITAAIAAASAAASPTTSVLIRHQLVGCHSWSVNGGAFKASQKIVVHPTTRVSFTDTDVMPHTLFQLSGPKVSLVTPNMHKPGAHASFQLMQKGTYVFGTKAGEDYMKGVVTKGEDNVLRLTVIVR